MDAVFFLRKPDSWHSSLSLSSLCVIVFSLEISSLLFAIRTLSRSPFSIISISISISLPLDLSSLSFHLFTNHLAINVFFIIQKVFSIVRVDYSLERLILVRDGLWVQ